MCGLAEQAPPARGRWPAPATEFLRCALCRAVLPEPEPGKDYVEIGSGADVLVLCDVCAAQHRQPPGCRSPGNGGRS